MKFTLADFICQVENGQLYKIKLIISISIRNLRQITKQSPPGNVCRGKNRMFGTKDFFRIFQLAWIRMGFTLHNLLIHKCTKLPIYLSEVMQDINNK